MRAGHLSYIRLRYTDENGITKPMQRGVMKVTVEGGTLVGLGSACPFHERSYLDSETDTYYGEALAIVRAGAADKLTLTAADGTFRGQAEVAITAE